MQPVKNYTLLLQVALRATWLLAVAAACLGAGKERVPRAEARREPRGAERFVFVAEVAGMVGGSSARSCTAYVADSGLLQASDEETDGTLHDLRSGRGDARALLRELPLQLPSRPAGQRPPPPVPEYYSPKLAITWLAGSGGYRSAVFETSDVPRKIADFAGRVKSAVRKGDLPRASPGLYARARRQLDFDPEIESPHATLSSREVSSLPLLSDLIAREMSLVRLGPPGLPAALTKDLQISPGRAFRIRVGNLVYLIQAYELKGSEKAEREPCMASAQLP